jgi:hypothetical protein
MTPPHATTTHGFVVVDWPQVFEELNGACFSDLSETQQECIKDYAINVHTIAHQSQPEFVFEVFERLNMGSTQLNEQELRNCIYQAGLVCLLPSPPIRAEFTLNVIIYSF